MMGTCIHWGALLIAMVVGISARTCPEVCFCSGTTVQCESLSEKRELEWSVRDMLTTTETLILNDYRSRGIQERTFSRLIALKTLKIESGRLLVSLVKDTFFGLNNLLNLTISGTALQAIPEGLFQPLGRLHVLHIINTPIGSLEGKSFEGLYVLSSLYITHNERLLTISQQTFDSLTNLKSLSISGSPNLSIGSNVFMKMTKLTRMDLSGVIVNSGDRGLLAGLRNMEYLYLKNCGLRSIDRFLLEPVASSLEVLDISKNEIRTFKGYTFGDCISLRMLNLSHNLQNSLQDKTIFEQRALSGMPKLVHLDMSYTDLSNLTTDNWIKILKPVKKVKINTFGCKYQCSCSAGELGGWLRKNNVAISLTCDTPTWIAGATVKKLTLDALKCSKPNIGMRYERFQIQSQGSMNASATVACGAYSFHGYPAITYEILEGQPFPEALTSETTETFFDDESRYNTYLIITIEDFTGETYGKIRCKATNDYGYTEWVVEVPKMGEMRKKTSANGVFLSLPKWVLGAVGVGAILFILVFTLVFAWRIRARRREREALRNANKNSDYYLECEKYEKYKIPPQDV